MRTWLTGTGPRSGGDGGPGAGTARRWPGFLAAFEVGAFRWVWAAALSGNSGRFAVILVAGWEAFRLGHHSSLWPSLVTCFLLIPTTFLGLLSGSVADRVNRAKQAAAGQLLSAASCGVAAALVFTGRLDLAGVLVASAVVGVGNTVQGPAWQALVPALVGRERILNASAVTRIAQQGAELTGPAAGTLLLATTGPGPVFLLCAAFYLSGSLMLWRVRREAAASPAAALARRAPAVPAATSGTAPPGATAPGRAGGMSPGGRPTVVEGFSYIRRRAPLATLLAWMGLHCSLTMASIGILPAVAAANLSGHASAYGLLLTAFGAGAVGGPVLLMTIGDRRRPGWLLLVSGVASGAPMAGLGMTHAEVVAVACAFLAGAGQAVFMACIYSSNMTVCDDAFRGRVASVQLSLATGVMGAASLGWGGLVAVMAPGLVLALPGLAFVAACGPFAFRLPHIDRGVLSHRAPPRPAPVAATAVERP